jgi:hypothetical protein
MNGLWVNKVDDPTAILVKLLSILKEKGAIKENDQIVFVSGVFDPSIKSQY